MTILNESIQFALPYTNAQLCYTRLESFPPVHQAFHETMVPVAMAEQPLADRLLDIEAHRQQALDDYLEAGNTLREVDTALNCCLADLYTALLDSIGFAIADSDLSQSEKQEQIQAMRDLLPTILDWNPTKRMELDLLLRGTSADIELDA